PSWLSRPKVDQVCWVQACQPELMEGLLSCFVLWSAFCAFLGFVAGSRCCRRASVASSGALSEVAAEKEAVSVSKEAVSDALQPVLRNKQGRHVQAVYRAISEQTMVHASPGCQRLQGAVKLVVRREVCSVCFPDKRRL
ncbi:unnamed protein product, partial [Prorocentrum cordatum]